MTGFLPNGQALAPSGETNHHHAVGDDAAAVTGRKNVFAALMEAMKTHSLEQISH